MRPNWRYERMNERTKRLNVQLLSEKCICDIIVIEFFSIVRKSSKSKNVLSFTQPRNRGNHKFNGRWTSPLRPTLPVMLWRRRRKPPSSRSRSQNRWPCPARLSTALAVHARSCSEAFSGGRWLKAVFWGWEHPGEGQGAWGGRVYGVHLAEGRQVSGALNPSLTPFYGTSLPLVKLPRLRHFPLIGQTLFQSW